PGEAVAWLDFFGADDHASSGAIIGRRNLEHREAGAVDPLLEKGAEVSAGRLLESLTKIVSDDVAVGIRRGVPVHCLPEARVTELMTKHLKYGCALRVDMPAEKDLNGIAHPFIPHDWPSRASIGIDDL